MKKFTTFAILVCSLMLMAACGKAIPEDDTISVNKKGIVTYTVVEEFDKAYYDAEELQAEIEAEIQAYNVNFAQDRLTMENFEVKDGVAVLQLQFEESKYYADYSGMTLFAGTVGEALEEGYGLSGECMGSDGALTDLGSIEEAKGLRVLVLEEAVRVEVPGEIVCVSRNGNVEITDKKEAVVKEAQQAFIIYK